MAPASTLIGGTIVIILLLHIFAEVGTKPQRMAYNYTDISCDPASQTFEYMNEEIPCTDRRGGKHICERLGFFPAKKLRCYRCCHSSVPSTSVEKNRSKMRMFSKS